MSDQITFAEVLTYVMTRATREELERLSPAFRERQRALSRQAAVQVTAELAVGDRVRVARNVSPKYLAGQVGHVTEIDVRRSKVTIKLAFGPVGKYSDTLTFPAACLTPEPLFEVIGTPALEADVTDAGAV